MNEKHKASYGTHLLQRVLLKRHDPRHLGVAAHRQLGRLEGAVVPGHTGQPVLGAVALLVRVVRLEEAGVLDLVLDLHAKKQGKRGAWLISYLHSGSDEGTYHHVPFADVENVNCFVDAKVTISTH